LCGIHYENYKQNIDTQFKKDRMASTGYSSMMSKGYEHVT